jgi:hypothetical protein
MNSAGKEWEFMYQSDQNSPDDELKSVSGLEQ